MLEIMAEFFGTLFSLAVIGWIISRAPHVIWVVVLLFLLAKAAGF